MGLVQCRVATTRQHRLHHHAINLAARNLDAPRRSSGFSARNRAMVINPIQIGQIHASRSRTSQRGIRRVYCQPESNVQRPIQPARIDGRIVSKFADRATHSAGSREDNSDRCADLSECLATHSRAATLPKTHPSALISFAFQSRSAGRCATHLRPKFPHTSATMYV